MKLQIIQIGNSLGIRIPKAILKQCALKDYVIVTVEDGKLILSSEEHPRQGWEIAFKKMAEASDDVLLDNEQPTIFDMNEWEW